MGQDEQRIKPVLEYSQLMKDLIICQVKESILYTIENGEAYKDFKQEDDKLKFIF